MKALKRNGNRTSCANEFFAVEGLEMRKLFSAVPTIASLTGDPNPVARTHKTTITANSVADSDGTVKSVQFYLDTNGNNSLDLVDIGFGKDQLLGTDIGATNGFSVTKTIPRTLALGDHAIFARARDNSGDYSDTASTTLTVINNPPTIRRAAARPTALIQSKKLTVSAGGVRDTDGQIAKVEFFLDANANMTIEPGVDTLLFTDITGVDGWKFQPSSTTLGPGPVVFMAQATDSNGGVSNTALAGTTLVQRIVDVALGSVTYLPKSLSLSQAGQTLTAKGIVHATGNIATGPYTVEFRLSTNNIFGDSDDTVVGSKLVTSLNPNATRTDTLSIAITSANLPGAAGNYFAMYKIESEDAITETDEANNVFISATADVAVTSTRPPGRDLDISHASYTPRTISASASGETITVSANVRNLNSDTTAGFSERFIISTNDTFGDSDDVVLGTHDVSGLAGGEARSDQWTIDLTAGSLTPGDYFGIVQLDSADQVNETDETNNLSISKNANITITA